jgi:TetR/AcrR family transcriptional regulator, transcriptional repressor for nem operon
MRAIGGTSKGEETRGRIVEQAAALFNQKGYTGASMSDLMEATGLQKGGLYRHFDSKEALAVEALDFAIARMTERFREAVARESNAVDRVAALVEVFAGVLTDPAVPGGCPLMNTAIENDDGNPLLRDRARRAMDALWALIERILRQGKERGEVHPDTDTAELATVVIGMGEGSLMLSQLYGDPGPINKTVLFLRRYLEEKVRG